MRSQRQLHVSPSGQYSITSSILELNDPDFIKKDKDEEEDRKFNEIMMKEVSLDNQIICQIAKLTTSHGFYSIIEQEKNKQRSVTEYRDSAEIAGAISINEAEADLLYE